MPEETTFVSADPWNDGEHWRLIMLFKARGIELKGMKSEQKVVEGEPARQKIEVIATPKKVREILLSDDEFKNRVDELMK
ncbi:MAG: hypothetical protein L3J07_04510 [Candidatus Magasanikbacteria bacterium]|nr:hypothetical protein [Candidatus Magasanikbacteria bacterium]